MASNLLAALKSNQQKVNQVSVNPLIESAKAGQVEGCQKALEDPKTKVDQKDPEGVSALMHAAMNGYLPVAQFLVEKGARISAKDDGGETALMKACKEGHMEVIQYLIDAQMAQKKKAGPLGGGDAAALIASDRRRILDAKDDEGVTALMKAAEQGEVDVVNQLLQEGATAEIKDDEGWNALMWAALAGNQDIVELLVQNYDMQTDYTTEKGETALQKAAGKGNWEVCEFLIDQGAKVNQTDVEGQTALMWAAAEGHLQVVRGLISKDAKVDLQTKLGKTALLLAAQFGREEVLLAAGAQIHKTDENGQKAIDHAEGTLNSHIVEVLREAAKQQPAPDDH